MPRQTYRVYELRYSCGHIMEKADKFNFLQESRPSFSLGTSLNAYTGYKATQYITNLNSNISK